MFSQCQPEEVYNLTYYWTITLVKDRVPYPIDKYCFVSTNVEQYVLGKGELEFGTYNLSLTVVSNENPSYFKQLKSKLMTVDLSKLFAKIQGNHDVILGWNDTYVLDFWSGSYDPEAANINNKKQLQFNVICSKELAGSDGESLNRQLNYTMYDKSYTYESLGFLLAFQYENINFYEKDCFHSSDPEFLNASIIFELETNTFHISMTSLNLNESSMTPITIRVYVSDAYRISFADQVVNLNSSQSFLVVPDSDLNMLAKQLDKLDDLASKDPKMALNLMSKFTDALNNYDAGPSSNVRKVSRIFRLH